MTVGTDHPYIVREDGILSGEPIIKGTRTPVRAIVELCRLGIAPEKIPEHLPYLQLDQVTDALGYYRDHQAEIEGYIELNRVPEDSIDPMFRGE